MALDQGTTSSRAIIFDKGGNTIAVAQKEFPQIYPEPGWVEHDAMEIWTTQASVAAEVLLKAGIDGDQICSIGITNQRETTVVWDRETGKPLYHAIVWQDRRTAGYCDELRQQGLADKFREKTGLIIDAYFSGTKTAGYSRTWKAPVKWRKKAAWRSERSIAGWSGTSVKDNCILPM
ncbi:FGGY family carbohydrate kinase [Chitinophaga sedimenti]|uniref:FGGY family carbohydrate kinase n=1 Tax=Chitinophaga sedimenti TaxID=2033606 RepID=UPI00249ED611|nr:FGGY family carbohydrate kinase [Chitinophaga sedimenti]